MPVLHAVYKGLLWDRFQIARTMVITETFLRDLRRQQSNPRSLRSDGLVCQTLIATPQGLLNINIRHSLYGFHLKF